MQSCFAVFRCNPPPKFSANPARARREEGARERNLAAPERWGGKRLVLALARKQSPPSGGEPLGGMPRRRRGISPDFAGNRFGFHSGGTAS